MGEWHPLFDLPTKLGLIPLTDYLLGKYRLQPPIWFRMILFHLSVSCRRYLARCMPVKHQNYAEDWGTCPICGVQWVQHHSVVWLYADLGQLPATEIGYLNFSLFSASITRPDNVQAAKALLSQHLTFGRFHCVVWICEREPTPATVALFSALWSRFSARFRRRSSGGEYPCWGSCIKETVHPRWDTLFRLRLCDEITACLSAGTWGPVQ